MRICHVTSAHKRYDVRIFTKECVTLSGAGYEVYLVVNDNLDDEVIDGVNIVSVKYKYSNRFERIFKSVEHILKKALAVDADVYHLHDPELLQISDVIMAKGKRVIFDAHEDTEMQITDKKYIPMILRLPAGKLYASYSRGKMKKLSGMVSVTPSLVEKLKRINTNTVMVTNYPILNEDAMLTLPAREDKYVFFAGGVTSQWCHENVAAAVSKLRGVKYLFAGNGSPEYIENVCSSGGAVPNMSECCRMRV